MKKRSRVKLIIRIFSGLLAVIIAAAAVYLNTGNYTASQEALAVLSSEHESYKIEVEDYGYAFIPEDPAAGFIFYPGGKVEPESYAALMDRCAEAGVLAVLVEMPFNLAIISSDRTESIMEDYSGITDWYIGGHSLGGVMAAMHLAKHPEDFSGLLLLAAYSSVDISGADIRVTSVYGTCDEVLSIDKYEDALANLPSEYTEQVIDGGCHSYFGDYGMQDGDGAPTITRAEQMDATAEALLEMIK